MRFLYITSTIVSVHSRVYLRHTTGADDLVIVEEEHNVSITCSDLIEHVGEDPRVARRLLEELTV